MQLYGYLLSEGADERKLLRKSLRGRVNTHLYLGVDVGRSALHLSSVREKTFIIQCSFSLTILVTQVYVF